MAAKVYLIAESGTKTEKVKRSVADYLVRNLMAIQRDSHTYQRISVSLKPHTIPSKPYIPFGLEPSIDSRIGVIVQVPTLPNQVRFRALNNKHLIVPPMESIN